MEENEMMSKIRQELNTIEQDLENEDPFGSFFTKESDVADRSTSKSCFSL